MTKEKFYKILNSILSGPTAKDELAGINDTERKYIIETISNSCIGMKIHRCISINTVYKGRCVDGLCFRIYDSLSSLENIYLFTYDYPNRYVMNFQMYYSCRTYSGWISSISVCGTKDFLVDITKLDL